MENIILSKTIPAIEDLYSRIGEAEDKLAAFVKEFIPRQKVSYLRSPAYITGVVAFRCKRCPEDFDKFEPRDTNGQHYFRPKLHTKAFKALLEVPSIHTNQWAECSGVPGAKAIIDEIDYYEVQI